MTIGEIIIKKIYKIYDESFIRDDYYDAMIKFGYWDGPMPRVSGSPSDETIYLYLNEPEESTPFICLSVERTDKTVEVHLAKIINDLGYETYLQCADEKIIKRLCEKYGLIMGNRFKNHFYTIIDSVNETDIKIKVGYMLTVAAFAWLLYSRCKNLNEYIADEYNYFSISRECCPYANSSSKGLITIEEVKEYFKKHDWVFSVTDTKTGFDVETVFVNKKGKPLKLSVYDSKFGVYLSSNQNYSALCKLENVDKILGFFDCERCDYLGYKKFECKMEVELHLFFFYSIITVMLIAENLAIFKTFLKDEKKKEEQNKKRLNLI